MMDSIQQQGYIFGVWLNAIRNITSIIYINGFGFIPCKYDKESLRYLLKLLDFDNYPRDEVNRVKSYRVLSKRELALHMEFITSEIFHSGFFFDEKINKFIKNT